MPTDPLFPPDNKVNASLDVQQQGSEPVNVTPNDATYVTNDTEASADYITATEVEGVDYYTVKPKDTLYSISRAYNLTVDKLMEINQLGSNVISAGMRLRVKP